MNDTQNDNLNTALKALHDEEVRITSEIQLLETLLNDVKATILPLAKLVGAKSLVNAGQVKTPIEKAVSAVDYTGLTIRDGILKYLNRYPEPASTAALTNGLRKDGYVNEGANFEKIVYINLRRGQEEGVFDRDPTTKKWSLSLM